MKKPDPKGMPMKKMPEKMPMKPGKKMPGKY